MSDGKPDGSERDRLVGVLRSGTLIALTIASVGLAIAELVDPGELYVVVGTNQFATSVRRAALVLLGLALLIGFGLAIAADRRGEPARERLGRIQKLTQPLVLSVFVPILVNRQLWGARELYFLIYLGVIGLVLERLLRDSFDVALAWKWPAHLRVNPRMQKWLPRVVLVLCITGYFVAISRYALISHARLATRSSDLAEFDNLFFNALHGHPFRAPAIDGDLRDFSALSVHAELVMYLLLPFYALKPGPESLLLLQTAAIALTALPIYSFASRRLGRAVGVLFAIVFLLWPAVQRPNLYDFHFPPFGMLFVAWTLYFLDRLRSDESGRSRRVATIGFVVALGLGLLSREDVAVGLAIAGFLIALTGFAPRWGLRMALAAGAYAIFALWLKRYYGPGWFHLLYAQLQVPGEEGLWSVFKTVVTNPVFVITRLMTELKLSFLLHTLVPLAFLWVRRPALALAILPAAPFTLLVTDRPQASEIAFQYTYLWVPYLVFASVIGLESVASERSRRMAVLASLIFASTLISFQYGALLGADSIRAGPDEKRLGISPRELERLEDLQTLIRLIPRDASVAATEHEGPHLSTRLVFYSLKTTLGEKPDFILFGGSVRDRLEPAHVARALDLGEYGLVAERGEFRLLGRGAPTDRNMELLNGILPPRRQKPPPSETEPTPE